MIRIVVSGDSHADPRAVIKTMDQYDPMTMGRVEMSMYTEATLEVDGKRIEFDIEEPFSEFGDEFGYPGSSDGFFLVANPDKFDSSKYETALKNIIKSQNKPRDSYPIILLSVGKKGTASDKVTKFATKNNLQLISVKTNDEDAIKSAYTDLMRKILPNLGADRLLTRPPKRRTTHIPSKRMGGKRRKGDSDEDEVPNIAEISLQEQSTN